jgi:choline-glycine betaine transporter
MVSMFVPVLGEIMLTVMAGQLLYESFEGAIEWSEGDRTAAKAHLIDVAENLAMIAVMAGAGKGLAKLSSVQPEPLVERLQPIQREDGKTRLES